MKKLILLLTILFAAPVYSNGDGIWVAQTSGITSSLKSVFFTDANNGTAVGALWNGFGIILRTTNGGTNWTQQSSGEPYDLYDVCFTDANNGTAVGNVGTILRTTNGGTNWISQTSGTLEQLFGVSFTDVNNGTIVGSNQILRTTNGGINWISQGSGGGNDVFFIDANIGTVVGSGGTILRTTNGGTNWISQSSGTIFHLTGVSFTDANTGTVVGFNTILRTTNGGANWISQFNDNLGALDGVSFTDANNGTVVGNDGIILRTTNGGTNWISQSSGTTQYLTDVSFTDAINGTAVGHNGTILRYKENPNYGDNEQSAYNLYYFANSTTGAVNAPSQPVFDWRDTTGSTDLIVNGVSIATLGSGNIDDGRYDIISQLPPGNSIKFFGTDYTDLYIGTNGIVGFTAFTAGGTWTIGSSGLPNPDHPTMNTAIFPLWIDLDYSNINVPVNRLSYKVTSNEVIITYDRAPLPGADANDYVSFQVVISHSPAPMQNSQIIFQFDDASSGSTFINKYNTNTLPAHISGLQGSYSTSQFLQYRYRSSTLLITDGPLFGSPLAVAFGPDDTALPVEFVSFTAAVNFRDVYLNWTTASEVNNSGFDVERSNIISYKWMKIGFINGNGTTIESKNYSYTDLGLNTGSYNYRLKQVDYNGNFKYFNLSNEVVIGIPEKYDLSQNYPNPFNPSTTIKFSVAVSSRVNITISNILGQQVMELVNDIRSEGNHEVIFNANNFAAGVYLYRITAVGLDGKTSFTNTRKMILMK